MDCPKYIDKYEFDERAGILEFDAGYTRKQAEQLAIIEITQRKKIINYEL